ncbi:hypothetical protein L2Y90_07755 [Burkholderia pyrrocinia]|uniref:hypothetical protein n=1 Tax=Burkholderia pyrrocinia TaxID=60550 RepID=UPI00215B05DE|nr:hypothetical protein [Burkholderia pyrrocinia]UVE66996.1 hypothetical protein L2Y90_07755 [Burkholderia pyrrocinia]
MKSDDVARATLEKLGLSVRKLPEVSALGKRADFIAKLDQLSLLVEAKLRVDDPEELERMENELAETGTYGSNHELGKNNALTSRIRDAVRQLEAEREEPHDYKVLLYLADCVNAEVVCEQIADTLYGTTSIMRPRPGATGLQEIPCYFYRENEFHPARSLDAAIVGFKSGDSWVLYLCLNPYSHRFNEIRTSALARMFADRTVDPIAEEAQGKAYIPDHDAPRPSKERKDFERMFSMADPMLRHLEKKYGVPPFTFSQGHFNKPILILERRL